MTILKFSCKIVHVVAEDSSRLRSCRKAMSFAKCLKAFAQIAQLVEQRTENPRVAGSIPALGTVNQQIALIF